MRTTLLALTVGIAQASGFNSRSQTNTTDNIACPIIFDGRIHKNLTLTSFTTASTSPYNPDYVKGVNLTWSDILLLPSSSANTSVPTSRFDNQELHQPLEVTIDSRSIFRAGENLQPGFRRAGLLLRDDANDPFADAADNGSATFHWSMRLDASRPFNLSHEYMNVWHEKADYSGNQFTFVGGRVLDGDGGVGVDWSEEEERTMWRVQDSSLKFVYNVSMTNTWQNFGIKLDYRNSTLQVFYSEASNPLQAVTEPLPNNNTGGGQLQIGIAKKPTETETVVFDGFHEYIPVRGEGQIYGGIFVEDSTDGCVSV